MHRLFSFLKLKPNAKLQGGHNDAWEITAFCTHNRWSKKLIYPTTYFSDPIKLELVFFAGSNNLKRDMERKII